MVDKNDNDFLSQSLGRIIFKLDAASQLLFDGKVIPAHEKMIGIRHILINLRSEIIKRGQDGQTKSDN